MQINHNIILLPTDKASNIVQHKDGKLFYFSTGAIKLTENHQQHLYLVSDEEIKWNFNTTPNCWVYSALKTPIVYFANTDIEPPWLPYTKKIIATTNPELKLPQIPQDFIKYFVSKQGNVKSVVVEYEETIIRQNQCINKCASYPSECLCEMTKETKPKLTKDNEVIITLEEKTYTRDEVKDLLVKYGFHLTGNMQLADALWIEQNL